jgi:hypothetical protein
MEAGMYPHSVRALLILIMLLGASMLPDLASGLQRNVDLTVHEWGTFTTVAGKDGRAVDWLPLSGPLDLPCFVYHYQNNPLIKYGSTTRPLNYEQARANLWGKVRMETPVLYFYAPRETSVKVRVQFPRGLMTEWYPAATVLQALVSRANLSDPALVSTIEWPKVLITPSRDDLFPKSGSDSHYYRARATDAAPIVVNGQAEKFLFYRGVADFDVPIAVEAPANGTMRIRNLGAEPLPAVILFENRDGALGYRMLGSMSDERIVSPPALSASFASLSAELVQILVRAGLYQKEAQAMVDTWRDSWFEEGTRVFYIVPPATTAALLPLTVTPAPAHIARVFVGRMDLITPAMVQNVKQLLSSDDDNVLDRYGRLLEPITARILERGTTRELKSAIERARDAAFSRFASASSICH